MGNRRHIPEEIKLLVVQMSRHTTRKELYRLTGITPRSQARICALYRKTGDVVQRPINMGRPRELNGIEADFLEGCIERKPDIYLGQLKRELKEAYGFTVSLSTISRTLARRGLTRKRLTRPAIERDEEDRSIYQHIMQNYYEPEQLVFVDESSVDRRTGRRPCGWAPISDRARSRDFFIRGTRYSILPALSLDGILHLDVIERAYTARDFNQFVDALLDNMNPWPRKNSVIVLDNASIHKSEELRRMVEERGMKMVFLPAYSPDFNPIEEAFSSIKAWLRNNQDYTRAELYGEEDCNPYRLIWDAVYSVTAEKAFGWFSHAGYFDRAL